MDKQPALENRNVIEYIYKESPYLKPALRRIADFILKKPEQCKTMTIKQLAAECNVAEATVTRFVKELKFNSYQELKIAIAETLSLNDMSGDTSDEQHVYEDISRTDSSQSIIEKVVYRNIQTLTETAQLLNVVELNNAVNVLEKARVIIFCCMGSSGVAAENGVMRFIRAGKKCLLFRDLSIQSMISAISDRHDLVIGISNSGRSTPVVESLKLAQSKGARTICITSFEDSPIVKYADIKLFTPTKSSPLGPGLYRESMTAKSAQILLIDILYACFAAKHFDKTLKFLEETYTAAIKETRLH